MLSVVYFDMYFKCLKFVNCEYFETDLQTCAFREFEIKQRNDKPGSQVILLVLKQIVEAYETVSREPENFK